MFMTGRLKQPIWILPLAIAGLVAVLGWWGNGRLRETIEGQLQAQLTATLNANVTALGIWTTNQTRLATSLAEDSTVRTLASEILQAAAARPAGNSTAAGTGAICQSISSHDWPSWVMKPPSW